MTIQVLAITGSRNHTIFHSPSSVACFQVTFLMSMRIWEVFGEPGPEFAIVHTCALFTAFLPCCNVRYQFDVTAIVVYVLCHTTSSTITGSRNHTIFHSPSSVTFFQVTFVMSMRIWEPFGEPGPEFAIVHTCALFTAFLPCCNVRYQFDVTAIVVYVLCHTITSTMTGSRNHTIFHSPSSVAFFQVTFLMSMRIWEVFGKPGPEFAIVHTCALFTAFLPCCNVRYQFDVTAIVVYVLCHTT